MVVRDVQKYVDNTDKLIEILNDELEKNEENF